MKIYVSESDDSAKNLLSSFEFDKYEEVDDVIILPGGLGSFYDLFRAIHDGKTVYLYNKNFFYTDIIKALYELHENGLEDKIPAEYLNIESDFQEILKKLEEKKDGKINDGKTSKFL